MTAEDKINRYLVLGLAVLAGGVFLGRAPSSSSPQHAVVGSRSGPEESSVAISRAELDAVIAELKAWVESSGRGARTPLEEGLGLSALGVGELERNPPARDLTRLYAKLDALPHAPVARPAAALAPAPQALLTEADPAASLAIFLESGVALDRRLALPSGEVSVKQLLASALGEPGIRRAEPDPWVLDLLCFAILGGLTEYREALARVTQSALRRLDREQRGGSARRGSGELGADGLEQMAAQWRRRGSTGERRGSDLHLSAAAFRAVAVLAEPQLEVQAAGQLNALLFRYRLERALYRELLTTSSAPGEQVQIRLAALENLGRLEQALYAAHLSFRRLDRPDPAPRTAAVMRQAALDLVEHWRELRRASVYDGRAGSDVARGDLLRAAVHALRGLRTARVAV